MVDLVVAADHLNGQPDSDSLGESLHPDKLGLVPEFVAQIASYTPSPMRQDDLDLIDRCRCGYTRCLHLQRALQRRGTILPDLRCGGSASRLSIFCAKSIRRGSQPQTSAQAPTPVEYSRRGNQFKARVREVIALVLSTTRRNRYPRSQRWTKGLLTFLCGGGSQVGVYQDCLKKLTADRILPTDHADAASNQNASKLTDCLPEIFTDYPSPTALPTTSSTSAHAGLSESPHPFWWMEELFSDPQNRGH